MSEQGIVPLTAEWHARRRDAITASDVAAIIGEHPWRTPYQVWAVKKGLGEVKESAAMEAGRYLEAAAAAWWEDVHCAPLLPTPGLLFSQEHDWLGATPDRIITDPDLRRDVVPTLAGFSGRGVWEGKSSGSISSLRDWNDSEPPVFHNIQLQIGMHVTGLDWGSFGAIIGGVHFRWMHVRRSDRFLDAVIPKVRAWKERYLDGDDIPEPKARDEGLLRKLHPRDSGRVIQLSEAHAADLDQLISAKRELKRWEAVKKDAAARLMLALQDASMATGFQGQSCTWRWHTQKRPARPAQPDVEKRPLLTKDDTEEETE